ncbi:polypeptide N-acetylgalactosaminyltransferase [Elysia marginata]|uniref:Polypeptide N-acetylgalactosaminyltransferase n=1 Tax=Elysia marginata TaxID=1093978 RepID=A0AAV4HNB9_9GAST|nr:polypeptide N-acetylgalactosaminyltransferase [Elysia marginata]
MPTLRYIKVKLNRLCSGQGMLLLVPTVWICVLLWSARTADNSARSSLHLNRRPERSFLHKSAAGHRNSKEKHSLHRKASALKHHRPRHGGAGDEDLEVKRLKQPSLSKDGEANGVALLKRVGFLGKVKKRKPSKKQQKTTYTKAEHLNKLLRPSEKRPEFDRPRGRNKSDESPLRVQPHLLQELPIPIVKDLDYTEVRYPNHGRDRQPILPGYRAYPPNMGEWGQPVNIRPETLNVPEKAKYDAGWANHKFNEYASSHISVERDVPDYRPSQCRTRQYSPYLPQASIIICFYNEAWSVLQRTIHSVFRRSPPDLISEVILVDDFSDMGQPEKRGDFLV